MHHGAGSSRQAERRVQQAQRQADRSLRRQPGGSPRLEQGDTQRLMKDLETAYVLSCHSRKH